MKFSANQLSMKDLKIVLDFMLEYGKDGSLPNMDAGGSGDIAYEAALRLPSQGEQACM